MGLNRDINLTLQDYETQLKRSFTYIKAIKSQNIEIFSASPVRIRKQKEIQYYEIGASNITDSGIIIVNRGDRLKKSANETSFNRQHLRVGDVVVSFRTKPTFGVIIENPQIAFIANTSMIILRTNSKLHSANLYAFFNQDFVYEYLKSLISTSDKNALSVDMLEKLLIPDLQYYNSDKSLMIMQKISLHYKEIKILSQTLGSI